MINNTFLRISIAAIFLSAGLIAYQISLLQVLSITQWYHFAFLIISIALLGWGVAGTFLSLFKEFFMKNFDVCLQLLCILCAVFMMLNNFLIRIPGFFFDTCSLLLTDKIDFLHITITIIMLMYPFVPGAMVLGILFTKYSAIIGKIYCANLTGSGIGSILILFLTWFLFPMKILIVIAFFPLLSAIFLAKRNYFAIFSSIFIIIFNSVILLTQSGFPYISEYKDIKRVLSLPDAKIIKSISSPYGLIQVLSSKSFRITPCLSLKFTGEIPPEDQVFVNADRVGSLMDFHSSVVMDIYKNTTGSLPYTIRTPKNVLILNASTGTGVAQALAWNRNSIGAVELNPILCSFLRKRLDKLNDKVSIHIEGSRLFLEQSDKAYDLIILPTINYLGENTGLNALDTQYIMTIEGFNTIWEKLSDNGIIFVSCWQDYPPRYSYKILSSMIEMLRNKGIVDVYNHICAVQSWGDISFMISKVKFQQSEINKINNFCNNLLFDPLIVPGKGVIHCQDHNQNSDFCNGFTKIINNDKNFYNEYRFNILPSTDDKPYFSQFMKITKILQILKLYRKGDITFMELGYLVLLITVLILFAVSLLMILLPLFTLGPMNQKKLWTLAYFGGIGAGYMFVEVVLIQNFIFYLNSPIYSVSLVVTSMLFFSGLGSFMEDKINFDKKGITTIFAMIVCFLILFTAFLSPFLHFSSGFSFLLKVIVTITIAGIPSYFMGVPFPVGIKYLLVKSEKLIPWGWAINSFFSVLTPLVALIISIEFGFSFVIMAGVFAYLVTFLAWLKSF